MIIAPYIRISVLENRNYNNISAEISKIDYYSDDVIFSADKIERNSDLVWTIKPLLTIDKNW